MKKSFWFAVILIMLSVFVLSACSPDAEEIDWVNIKLGHILPEPQSNLMKILSNDDETLSVYIHKISVNDYLEYQRWCEEDKGFNIETESIGTSFYAYNQDGYYLSLFYNESQDQMHISLDAPIPMEDFKLPEYAISAGLPIPSSNQGHFNWQNEDSFSMYIGNTSKDDYFIYKNACITAGFTNDPYEYNTVYSATNADGYKVSLNYKGFNIFSLEFSAPKENNGGDTESGTSAYTLDYADAASFEKALNDGAKVKGKVVQFRVNEYAPDSVLGINCHAGEHLNFLFENELDVKKDDSIVVRVTEEPSKAFLLDSWKIPCEFIEVSEHAESPDNNVENETSSSDSESNDPEITEITLTMGKDDFKGMNYQEAETLFREMGFTKFKYRTVDTETESAENTICYIEITEWLIGKSNFKKGDKFDVDSTITFFTYKYKAPPKPSPVFYSTNDYETAKKGNTGVFSYRDRGSSYDIYWIIDFDEGYVYYFTDGNGESFCDRLKIESGTLNDKITITYHDGGDTWSYKLHFKYVNQPETLIMVDQNGFDWKYSTTDLDDALALRATKRIKDY